MEKYFKRKLTTESTSSTPILTREKDRVVFSSRGDEQLQRTLDNLPADPGLRPRMTDYDSNIRDQVRRAYLQRGPCQPKDHDFPQTLFTTYKRRFHPDWFDKHPYWLEYSISKDAAFCLPCYLMKPNTEKKEYAFIEGGWRGWNKAERLDKHVGAVDSVHNKAVLHCQALMSQKQHIETSIIKHTDQARVNYRICLNASVACIRFLLRQGLAFRGHDETKASTNKGNFLELLHFLADQSETIKSVVLKNAPGNLKLTASSIQKDIVNAVATKTINAIFSDMGDALFSILIDEARDTSIKEQMVVVFRYVNKKGQVIERFVGVQHVASTTAVALKDAIDDLFSRYKLSISRLRGQGYDGASNMQGEFNGLKAIILRENECAFYVHCFAHQLQLALVAVSKNDIHVASFFMTVSNVVNIVGASCKRLDVLREKQKLQVVEAIQNGELLSGQGLNQETSLKRAGDTRWGSHYGTLLSMITMFSPIVEVLEMIVEDGVSSDQRGEANNLLESILSFKFVFILFLMRRILGITNALSQALQRKDQDIVNAMALVRVCKDQLHTMRESEWDTLLHTVSSFCENHDIDVPTMESTFVAQGRSRRRAQTVSNLHHYRVELFYVVIDRQLQELNNRFNEINTELLLCLACLSPDNLFSAFDKQKLLRLAHLYPKEFSDIELLVLEDQLGVYITDMRLSDDFSELKGINNLAQKMVETGRNKSYPLVYLLLTLALVLPVATASVERVFSAMNIVKRTLRNRMGING